MSAGEDATPSMGDVVEHKMNTDVYGIVIGFMGSLVGLRVSRALNVLWFHEWELQAVSDDEYHEPSKEEAPAAPDDNVIDFTQARKLRAGTKTKGAA